MMKRILFFWNQNSQHSSRKPDTWELLIQATVVALCALILVFFFSNYLQNISQRNIELGYDFLDDPSGYQIGQSLIEYDETSNYFRVYLVGLLNTLLASVLAIILATIIGLLVGLSLLTDNLLLRKISEWYIEILRNLPPLLHVLFWYIVVILKVLPDYDNGIKFFDKIFLNVRGLTIPEFHANDRSWFFLIVFVLALAGMVTLLIYSKKRMLVGRPIKVWHWNLVILGTVIVLTLLLRPYQMIVPEQGKFNFTSGFTLRPELFAIVVALATYTSTFVAAIVRSSILSIPKHQIESAHSLGLNYFQRTRHVTLPLALRSMIPPLTNQYLNIIKNSSLGVAIAYPEIVTVFAGTALNQTGRAIEIMTMVMLTYLAISLFTSWIMNRYNAKVTSK